MADTYYIGAYWGSRASSIEDAADTTAEFLSRLYARQEVFQNWFLTAGSKREALDNKAHTDASSVANLLRCDDKELGFSLRLWNGKEREDGGVGLSLTVGSVATFVKNRVVLRLSSSLLNDPSLLKAVTCDIVECWKPQFAVTTSDQIRSRFKSGSDCEIPAAWIWYLSDVDPGELEDHGLEVAALESGSIIMAQAEPVRSGSERDLNSVYTAYQIICRSLVQ